MRSWIRPAAGACLLLLGCSGPGEVALVEGSSRDVERRPSTLASTAEGRVAGTVFAGRQQQSPFALTVEGPGRVSPGQEARLLVRIRVRIEAAAPIDLRLDLPRGLVLLSGKEQESIAEVKPGEILRHFEVRVDDPEAALEVTARMVTDDFGAIATTRHQFRPVAQRRNAKERPRLPTGTAPAAK